MWGALKKAALIHPWKRRRGGRFFRGGKWRFHEVTYSPTKTCAPDCSGEAQERRSGQGNSAESRVHCLPSRVACFLLCFVHESWICMPWRLSHAFFPPCLFSPPTAPYLNSRETTGPPNELRSPCQEFHVQGKGRSTSEGKNPRTERLDINHVFLSSVWISTCMFRTGQAIKCNCFAGKGSVGKEA